MTVFTLNLDAVMQLTEDTFYQLWVINRHVRLERNARGEVVIIPPTEGEINRIKAELISQLGVWNKTSLLGEDFDSSTGFTLPNSAVRSPEVAWIEKSRWDALIAAQKQKFIPLCPDFVIEIISPSEMMLPSDVLKLVESQMQEYSSNGCRLGWLINPEKQEVEIYRLGQEVEVLNSPQTLSGESVLPGFVLNLSEIWDKMTIM